ncbi:MAG: hypothetical protein ACHQ50_07635 [Fimbriimonadales bacterium]
MLVQANRKDLLVVGFCSQIGSRKHLQVLVDARLATLEPKGRDVLVTLDTAQLERAQAFIAELESRWDARLEALRRFVEE